jgi:hypothetical protein
LPTSDSDVPKPTSGDHLHAIARAGISSLPLVGNAAVELFNAVVTPPLERRRDAWRATVGQRLHDLEASKFITLESLKHNEAFIDATLQASHAAMRTHHEEKLQALSNAIANSALPTAPGESFQQLFIQWVDELTVDHLRFLQLFRDPRGWFSRNGVKAPEFSISSSLSALLEHAYPDLGKNRELYDLIAAELSARKLFSGSMHTMMSGNGAWAKRTTELGDKFIDYISEPKKA